MSETKIKSWKKRIEQERAKIKEQTLNDDTIASSYEIKKYNFLMLDMLKNIAVEIQLHIILTYPIIIEADVNEDPYKFIDQIDQNDLSQAETSKREEIQQLIQFYNQLLPAIQTHSYTDK